MIKNLYIYWGKKFVNAPYIVKICLLSWKLKNPTWNIIELDDENLGEYINIDKEFTQLKNKNIQIAAYSDIIRVCLLDKYGGCWCDATTFCNKPLDDWLPQYIKTGFFAFEKPGVDRLMSTWFLYSEKNNLIIKRWKKGMINYWNNHESINHYFRHHFIFNYLYKVDFEFQNVWDLTPKINASGPHFLQQQGLLNDISDKVKNHIDEIKTPLYKLTYKYDENKYNKKCNLYYIINSINN